MVIPLKVHSCLESKYVEHNEIYLLLNKIKTTLRKVE